MGRDGDGQILRQFKAVRWQLAYRTQDAERVAFAPRVGPGVVVESLEG